MKSVLVLDANQRSALAVTRSLGRRRIRVLTADTTPSALAGCSRYSAGYLQYPSPANSAEDFIERILHFARHDKVDTLLPMTELTTELILRSRERFDRISLPFADLDTISSLSDKSALIRMAQALNVPAPETWFVDNPGEMSAELAHLPYPLILKPNKSWICHNGSWQRVGVQIASTPEAARQLIETDPSFQNHPFMLQRCVEGVGQGVFALYDQGMALCFFSHRRIREKPPWGGVSVLSESVKTDEILLTHARALLDAVGWHGIAMVEFKVSADGTPYLMEINTRFWGSLQLAVDSGVDFPWMVYNLALGQPVTPVTAYKTGRRLRWLLGDLDSLYLTLKSPASTFQNRILSLVKFFTPRPLTTRHEVDRWSDLGPFWCELKQYLRDLRR